MQDEDEGYMMGRRTFLLALATVVLPAPADDDDWTLHVLTGQMGAGGIVWTGCTCGRMCWVREAR